MADTDVIIAAQAEPDPQGWTSKPASLSNITKMLASTVGAPSSGIKNILEEKDLDQYIFSYTKSGSETFYLFSSGGGETYQVETPRTQKELWAVLKNKGWRKQLKLTEL